MNEGDLIKTPKKEPVMELIIRGASTSQQQPEQVFSDQAGWHCLVTFNTDIVHYFHISSSKSLMLNKFSSLSQSITSIAWSRATEKSSTREMLVGTNKGNIIEMVIEYDSTTETVKHNINVLFNVQFSIFGLEYVLFSGLPGKLSVIVACPKHLYQFIGEPNEGGRPNFPELFKKYKDSPARLQRAVHEFSGDIKKNQLQVYYVNNKPDSFCWMNSVGLFFGKLPVSAAEEVYVGQMKPVQCPKGVEYIVGIGMSNYHLYFLGPTSLQVVSKISQQVVHTIEFEKRQGYEMIGLSFDDRTHSFFAWSQRFIYQIVIEQESRDVWKYYVEQNMFEEAIKFCEKTGSSSLAKVKGMFADFLYESNEKVQAAEAYGNSEYPFEGIALKLIDDHKALQRYIETKLKNLSTDMNAQRTLLSTWLVEIYLDNINQNYMKNDDSVLDAERQLQKFLELHQLDLDEETTCDLLQSHGRIEDWVFFADLRKKHEMVMLHHINQQEIRKALTKLGQIDPNGKENLLYKFAPIFMKYEPRRSVEILIEMARQKKGNIDLKKLIPALMNVDHNSREEAIKFESFLIKDLKLKDKALHNLYLFHLSEGEDEKKIIEYLKLQENLNNVNFDSEYAMTVFKQNHKLESQIFLYSLLKMHSEAVTLALELKKLGLAKSNAQKPERFDEELARKLWLQIAIFHIKEGNVRDALDVMNESKLIKMEDLLPYFEEQEPISNFKEEICKALSGYKKTIDDLNEELRESKTSASQVKGELKVIQSRYIEIDGMQPCEVCNRPIMKKSFFVYPCTHAYHKDCLLEMMIPILKSKDHSKASRIKHVLNLISVKEGATPKKSKKNEESKETIEELNEKLDKILAPLCYFCSPQFIESVKDELIENKEEEEQWSIDY